MQIENTVIEDTFAEAFGMTFTRLIVTAIDEYWVDVAVKEASGYGSSVIACDAETACERELSTKETPDGRPGRAMLLFAFSTDALQIAVANRVGQCLMTCPTTAVFNGLPDSDKTIPLGDHVRFFGDGFQKSKRLDSRRYWRIPVMDGEFVIEDKAGVAKGIAGGNFIIQSTCQKSGLRSGNAVDRSDKRIARNYHTFSRRYRAKRQQSWIEIQRNGRFNLAFVLSVLARPG